MTSIFDRHMSRGTADRLTRQFEAAGNRIADLRKQGICTHGWLQARPVPSARRARQRVCIAARSSPRPMPRTLPAGPPCGGINLNPVNCQPDNAPP